MTNLSTTSKEKLGTSSNTLALLFLQLRPKQWTKNILVFAAPLFSFKVTNFHMILQSLIGFFLFCFVSGCVYILNDFVDREADRNHPEKKYRPMASGALNPYIAICVGAILLLFSLAFAFNQNIMFGVILSLYFVLNVAYSFKLKHVVIVDVMIIASGFVFRAIGGGLIINVPFTPWFIICTMLLALFLALSKRRHELSLLQRNKSAHRKVLESYSISFVDQLNSIVITGAIISYSLFTFTSGHTIYLMLTIPFVIYGIFRYIYLIHMEEKGGSPEKVLLEDKHVLVTVILYALLVFIILNYFD
ncbi:decaprenyl-phosphate phosphoribosyltransferase [Paenibacillus sp. MZ04-78.2]|uniref:decaprenyl-phosphate phosphoribosyltransferase n=1 Tax=Paenibacillus sp. MZ04-78.2 TaxID=2962034 RepID=UPI0020B8D6E8|nr:decaprenyl-phosphate phosphoribosyltransferase [Paenibacillus sp. MZ04-78.2]MCP3774580.1 decaprenyl-phosphate phosphoribosyltransferase [Paenibacillus sp. MZ04-78.2]